MLHSAFLRGRFKEIPSVMNERMSQELRDRVRRDYACAVEVLTEEFDINSSCSRRRCSFDRRKAI
jgi:hypothetical protein